MTILFRWLFTDGVLDGLFARTGTASFVTYAADTPEPYKAYDLSRPFVLARSVVGGTTL